MRAPHRCWTGVADTYAQVPRHVTPRPTPVWTFFSLALSLLSSEPNGLEPPGLGAAAGGEGEMSPADLDGLPEADTEEMMNMIM